MILCHMMAVWLSDNVVGDIYQGPTLGALPQTPVIGSHSALAMEVMPCAVVN